MEVLDWLIGGHQTVRCAEIIIIPTSAFSIMVGLLLANETAIQRLSDKF